MQKTQEELQKELDKSNHTQEGDKRSPGVYGFTDDTPKEAQNEEMKKKGQPTLTPEQIKKLEEEKHKFEEGDTPSKPQEKKE